MKQLDVAEIAALPVPQLLEFQTALDTATENLKATKEAFAAALARKYGELAQAELTAERKATGTVNLVASNSTTLKVEYGKTVVWDQAKLGAVLAGLPAADAKHYGKYKLEVEEKKFAEAPADIKALLETARTVKVGAPKFTLKLNAEAA